MWTLLTIGGFGWMFFKMTKMAQQQARLTEVIQHSASTGLSQQLLDSSGFPMPGGGGGKLIPGWVWLLGGFLYVICPLDFDFIPFVGWVDDAVVAFIALYKAAQA